CERIPSNFQLMPFKQKCFFVKTMYGDESPPLRFWEVEQTILKMYPAFYDRVLAEVTAEWEAKRQALGRLASLLPRDPKMLVVPSSELVTGVFVPGIVDDAVRFHDEIGDVAPPRTIQFAGHNRECV